MAKIYRYINDISDKVEVIEGNIDELQTKVDLFEDEGCRIIVPLETAYIPTTSIRISLGNEIVEMRSYINKIKMYGENHIDLFDKIGLIRSIYPYNNNEIGDDLTELANEGLDYECTFNPSIIEIVFKETVNIHAIELYTNENRKYNRLEDANYQGFECRYFNLDRGVFMTIESKKEAFHPEFGLYNVDFSMIQGSSSEFINKYHLVTEREINLVLQDYVKRTELEELFQKEFGKMVNAISKSIFEKVTHTKSKS